MPHKISGDKETLVILVHGVNTKDVEDSVVGRIDNYFQSFGCDTYLIDYGWVGVIGPILKNPEVAAELKGKIEQACKVYKQVWVVGHSNGCAIIHMMAKLGKLPEGLTKACFIAPAVEAAQPPLPGFTGQTYVFWNQYDLVGIAAELANDLSPDVIDERRPWGSMATTGYTGPHLLDVHQWNLQDKEWAHNVVGIKSATYGMEIVRIMLGTGIGLTTWIKNKVG